MKQSGTIIVAVWLIIQQIWASFFREFRSG